MATRDMRAVSVASAADAVRRILRIEDIFDVIYEEQTENHHKHGDVSLIEDASPNAGNGSAHPSPQEQTPVARQPRASCSVGSTALE